MGVDVDPKVLAESSAASAHAFRQARKHIDEEIAARNPADLSALMGSLAPTGPYAYTLIPKLGADGSVQLPILTTWEEIHGAYGFIRGMSDLHEVVGLTEVRGSWYLFQDALTVGGPKDTGDRNDRQTLGLFPSGAEHGITGELVWLRQPRLQLGAPDDVVVDPGDELHERRMVHDRFDQHLAGLRHNDLAAILEPIHDLAGSAVRDYVEGGGALVELNGKDDHRAWYGQLLDRYELLEVQELHRITDTWYTFGELRITASERGSRATVAFHVAEYHVPAKDGRFIARIGHGTEPA